MTEKEKAQWNQMREALQRIACEYQTSEQMRESAQQQYGLEFEEALEMAYENLQEEARQAIEGIEAQR